MSVQKAPKPNKSQPNYLFLTLRLFSHMRWLVRSKAAAKRQQKPAAPEVVTADQEENNNKTGEEGMGVVSQGHGGDWAPAMRKSVKMIHFGSWEEKEAAAAEIARLAAEQGLGRRMAELGVIPPLVAMAGSESAARRGLAVRALIELANGSYTNKALMVEAGLLSRLPNNIDALDETSKQELAHLLSSVSSLAKSKFSLDSSKIVPTLLSILDSTASSCIAAKKACLTALYNLSSVLENTEILISNGTVDRLINLSSAKDTSEKSLAILGNLVVTLAGKRSIEQNPTVPERFIEITTWEESPKCQELSAYILMVLAHQSPVQRQKMAEAGIVQVLLGLALLGSPLGRKRALKILQWFKEERREMRVGPHSGPQGVVGPGPEEDRMGAEEGKALMRKIVKESLYKNLETITSRAMNGDEEGLKLKALAVSSSSKSLPY